MVLEILHYGHPALRSKGQKVKDVKSIAGLAQDMLDTMCEAKGVGLAAPQVGRPLQLCIIDVSAGSDPSRMWVGGEEVEHEDFMPLCLINPVVEGMGKEKTAEEGCLSVPGVAGNVTRTDRVRVKALDIEGVEYEFEAAGLLARAIQHEYDHLQGVLYIDRLSDAARKKHAPKLDAMNNANGGIA